MALLWYFRNILRPGFVQEAYESWMGYVVVPGCVLCSPVEGMPLTEKGDT